MIKISEITEFFDAHAYRIMMAATGFILALFASFLMVLVEASMASAQQTSASVCGGKDLLAAYAENEPEKLATLKEQAADSIYGEAIFWKLEKDGIAPSYVLGTMHMADERIAKLEGARLDAFKEAQTVIVENIEALDPAQASAAMLQYKDMTLYTDGTTLVDRLDEETVAKLKIATEARGIPFSIAQIMQPWLVATSVALPACEIAAKGSGKPVLDSLIAQTAKAEGKQLIGLETIGEQFSAISSLPEDFHISALKETLNMGDLAEDVMETMKQLYLEGNIAMITPLTKMVTPGTTSSPDFEGFQDALITKRNALMVERALPHVEKGGAFIAVGALHLPDESGLINQFAKAGFKVSAVQ